MLRRRYH